MTFILDTDILAGSDFQYGENIIEDRGRSLTIDWTSTGLNQDLEVSGFSIRFWPAEQEAKEQA